MTNLEVPHSQALSYRPAIDGLRALAILSVFVFHLKRTWLPGGFVGVDVFFVISGYLITTLLLKEQARHSFSLLNFYQRRVARIFPAFFLVGMVTLAGAAAIYSPQDFASTGMGLVAAALSVANVKFMVQGDYFTISPDAQPLLHYWSLSVEEQFYLLFPLLLAITSRWTRERLRRLFLALWVVTFAACVVTTYVQPVWAFYLLPTRAWELLTGAVLATAPVHSVRRQMGGANRAVPFLGLAVVGLSFLITPEDHTFPGAWALLPVLGTAAVIRPRTGSEDVVERWLSAGPLVLLGKLSYSLYLWHWPIFSLVDYRFYAEGEALRLSLKLLLTLPAAYLTYRFVEGPARTYLSAPRRGRAALAFLVVAFGTCVPLGLWVRNTRYIDASRRDVAQGGRHFGDATGGLKLVLMGDSQGSMYARLLKEVCEELHCDLTVVSVAAEDPLPRTSGAVTPLWEDTLSTIRRVRPNVLLIACDWRGKLREDSGRLSQAIQEASPYANHIVLFGQPPILPPGASRKSIREGARWPFYEEASVRKERLESNSNLLRLGSERLSVLDVGVKFEDPDGSVRFWDDAGREVYQDSMHLSYYGANLLRGDLMRLLRISGTLPPAP